VERTLMPRPLAGTGARRPRPQPPTISAPADTAHQHESEGPEGDNGEAVKEFPPAYRFGGQSHH
jgi:hypothetical protein